MHWAGPFPQISRPKQSDTSFFLTYEASLAPTKVNKLGANWHGRRIHPGTKKKTRYSRSEAEYFSRLNLTLHFFWRVIEEGEGRGRGLMCGEGMLVVTYVFECVDVGLSPQFICSKNL